MFFFVCVVESPLLCFFFTCTYLLLMFILYSILYLLISIFFFLFKYVCLHNFNWLAFPVNSCIKPNYLLCIHNSDQGQTWNITFILVRNFSLHWDRRISPGVCRLTWQKKCVECASESQHPSLMSHLDTNRIYQIFIINVYINMKETNSQVL